MTNIELELTLRCNGACINCNKFCNMQDLGIIYGEGTDLTLEDVRKFIEQVKAMPDVRDIRIMGGEPSLNPNFKAICDLIKKELVDTKIIRDAYVVTNGVNPVSCSLRCIVQIPQYATKIVHSCSLVSPFDTGAELNERKCITPSTYGISFGKYGWYFCGIGGAIARLLGITGFSKESVISADDWGDSVEEICQHCQYRSKNIMLQKDHGRPISATFQQALDKLCR